MKSKLKRAIEAAAIDTVEGLGAASAAGTFRFAADFPGFAGHFPGHPVLPAVVQVLSAQLVVERWLGRPLVMQQLERAKFLRQVRPEESLRVVCRERKSGVWDAHLEAEGEPASAFWMVLAEEEIP